MADFLNSVLPTQGAYCVVGIRGTTPKQTFHDSIEDVDAVGSGLDSQGVNAYFALASYKTKGNRTAANAAFLRSFFLDLDCGQGKPYADQAAAAQALAGFLKITQLPTPTLVNSGGGVHVYWPLTEDVPVETWLPFAKSLKKLCVQEKLHADPAVTADSARVLRIPGTHNFKGATPRPVQIISAGQPVSLAEFTRNLPAPAMDLSAAKQFGMDDTSKDLAGGDYPACSFSRLAQASLRGVGCNQIRIAIVDAATLEEPLWRGALSIAVRCEDGAQAIHDLSKPHPGYSASVTEDKASETKGPYTCEWYKLNNPRGCEECQLRITTPITLGREVEFAPAPAGTYELEKPEDETSVAITLSVPTYPFPYFRGANGGVYRKQQTPDGDTVEVEVYPHDLYLTERFFDYDEQGSGEGEMAGINLHMKQDGVRRFFAPATHLFTPDKLRDLLVRHGVVTFGKHTGELMAYFASSLRKLQTQYAANKTRNQMGWTADMLGFVVGEVEYTSTGTKLAPPASGTRQLASSFKPTGTLEEWKSIANFYNRPGLEPHALSLFFGFGSPLLKLIGPKNNVRGAQVHLKHNGSGSGKSTAQMVVNSIFGHPDELLMKKEDTAASKMHLLGMVNSMAFTVDEITNEEPKVLSDMAYGFTSGRGKHRMEAQSNKLRANNTTWCNITITSGNASVVDVLQQFKSTADGELRRILEISVPKYTGATKTEIDAVFSRLSSNYGVAGPVFIEYVLRNMGAVTEMLHQMQARIDAELHLDQADRFHSCILTCAFVGAGIAKQLGLHDIEVGRIYKYALRLVDTVRVTHKQELGDPNMIAQETLGGYINENIQNALVVNYVPKGGVPENPLQMPRGPLRLRYEPNTRELIIPSSEFRKYFAARQVDIKDSITRLTAAGIAKFEGKSHPIRIGAGAIGSMGGLAVRCYVFDGDAIGVDENAFASTPDVSAGDPTGTPTP